MPSQSNEPFPLEAVRDLLGMVRAIYAAAKQRGAPRHELAKITRVGKQLSDALDLAVGTRPDTVGSRAAWREAEEATQSVMDLIDALTPAEPMLLAAKRRVTGGGAALKRRREER